MSTALKLANFLTVEDYLEGEKHSQNRHEYIGGSVYAMAGTSDAHNSITCNLLAALHAHVRKGPCRVFMSDVKVRLQIDESELFYYPDIMVTCDSRDTNAFWKQFPKVIVEVTSPSTERQDRGEKFWNYTKIDSLEEYLIVAQDKIEVLVFRRSNGWKPELARSARQSVRLRSIDFSIPISDLYRGVRS